MLYDAWCITYDELTVLQNTKFHSELFLSDQESLILILITAEGTQYLRVLAPKMGWRTGMQKVECKCSLLLKSPIPSKLKADSPHVILYSSIVGTARRNKEFCRSTVCSENLQRLFSCSQFHITVILASKTGKDP